MKTQQLEVILIQYLGSEQIEARHTDIEQRCNVFSLSVNLN